jgi:hypothetical protein
MYPITMSAKKIEEIALIKTIIQRTGYDFLLAGDGFDTRLE